MRASRRNSLTNTRVRATPLLVFGAMLSASLAMRCASKSDPGGETGNGGSSGETGGTVGLGGSVLGGMGGTISLGGAAGSEGAACSAETMTTDCAVPPHSTCLDSWHIAYYTNPACVAGRCTFSVESYQCPGLCTNGACTSSTTTVMIGPPPPDPRCLGGMSGAAGSSGAGGAGDGGAMGARIILGGQGGLGFAGMAGTVSIGGAGQMGGMGGAGQGGMGGAAQTAGMGGMGAMGTTGCELPPSVCLDATTLVYYTEPHCDAAQQCIYTTNMLDCMGSCTNGACQGGFTAPAPP